MTYRRARTVTATPGPRTVAARPSVPVSRFPARCPVCEARRVPVPWRDYPERVEHGAGCRVYLSRLYDAREPVAHLLRLEITGGDAA